MRTLSELACVKVRKEVKLMDEKGAVNRARGELERRRQKAYRDRAAATVKIQRWYRQRRLASRARIPTNDGGVRGLDSLQLPTEESCTESTSATLSTVSHREEIEGIRHMVGVDKESSDDNPVQNHHAWSSSSQLQERTNSFDEFVNSEVAVARAMVDDRYMENLNDAQKKRVKRLKAYRKTSDNQMAASETLQNQSSNASTESSVPSNSSSASQVTAGDVPGHKSSNVSEEAAAGVTKSSIPVRKPLHKRGTKTEAVKKAEAQSKPQMAKQIETPMQDAQVPTRKSKQKLSKPTSNQKKQWTMKEQHVQKTSWTKEHRQLEQPDSIDQANGDTCTEPVKAIKNLVKIGDVSEMASANDTNMQELEGDITTEHTLKDDIIKPSSSSEGGTQASQQTKAGANTQGQKDERKQTQKMISKGQKVLKFASNVIWQNSNSTVHDPSIQHSETKPRGTVKQTPHLITAEMDQSQQGEDFSPLKKSNATTRLTLECENEIQSYPVPLLKRRHRTTEEISSDSSSFLNLGQSPRISKSNNHPTEAQRQRIIDAALANTDDSDSDDSSPKHLAYAGIQPRAARVSHAGAKFASHGGGYGAAYAKRRETNRKRIIRSLRTPQYKPKEKKEPAGYLKKFLHLSMAQNYLDDLVTSSAPPGYSSGNGSWHTAWTSMGGLPRPGVGGLHTPPEHSPPPEEWVSVMNRASSLKLFEGSYDSPLHHHLTHRRRRPHHLHPLDAPAAGSKQLRTSKTGHPKSYTYHYSQQLRQQAVRQPGNHSQLLSLSNHRRSLSHVIPRSWRKELHYEPDMIYNRYRGAI